MKSKVFTTDYCTNKTTKLFFMLRPNLTNLTPNALVIEKKKKISHRQLGPLRGSTSPFQHFEPARVKPN